MWEHQDPPEGASLVPTTAAVELVQGLVSQMVRCAHSSIVVRASEPLPAVRGLRGAELRSDYSSVVNRLKVICNLHPMCYPRPVSGKVEMALLTHEGQWVSLLVYVTFHDREPDTHFEIRFKRQNA